MYKFKIHLIVMTILAGLISRDDIILRIKTTIIMSFALSPVTWFLDRLTQWTIDNEEYVAIIVFAIAIDHLLGTLYHAFWAKDFSLKKNVSGLMVKLVIVVTMGYLFEGLNELMHDHEGLKEYTIMVCRLMVFLYPAGSAFRNSYEMTGRRFPPIGFMEKLEEFSKFKKPENEKQK